MLDLIYDVGVNDGSDSAYYLRKAARVVGIEASPAACDELRVRFAREIAEGRYILLNEGVAEERGEFDFWVCEEHPEWSSFDRALAGRFGQAHHGVKVQARPFAEMVDQYGRADFIKIDIEGHDKVCLASLRVDQAPRYISVELAHADGDVLIEELTRLGYRDFKIISQYTMASALKPLVAASYYIPSRFMRPIRKIDTALRGNRQDDGWEFAHGSSGSFGEGTAGRWQSAGYAMKLWRFLRDIDNRHGGKGVADWFDIHGRLAA